MTSSAQPIDRAAPAPAPLAPVVPLERDFSKVPHSIANRTQRLEEGGFALSARAVGLYAEIRKHCHRQRSKAGGTTCEVSLERLGAGIGVKVRRTRQLVRQLEEHGVIRVELGEGFRGTNVFHLVLPVPVEQLQAPKPRRTPAIPCTDVPRQDPAADVDVGVREVRGVEVDLDPTPGAAGAAPRAARSGARRAPPSSPAPAAREPQAGGGVIARSGPAWPGQSADWESVLGRQLRIELPGVPPEVVAYACNELRLALVEEKLGGERVRNRLRYAKHVAQRRWAWVKAAEAERARCSASSGPPEPCEPARPCDDTTANASTEASSFNVEEPCKHGLPPDETCRTCDDPRRDAVAAVVRAAQRVELNRSRAPCPVVPMRPPAPGIPAPGAPSSSAAGRAGIPAESQISDDNGRNYPPAAGYTREDLQPGIPASSPASDDNGGNCD